MKPWGQVQPVTYRQMELICIENARLAAISETEALRTFDSISPGDPRATDLRHTILARKQDQPHWRAMAAWYRTEGNKRGLEALVPIPAGMLRPGTQVAPERKPVLLVTPAKLATVDREVGSDDEDLPF